MSMATVQSIAEALHPLLMEGYLSQVTPPAGAVLYMYQPCHGVCNTMQLSHTLASPTLLYIEDLTLESLHT